MNNIMCNDNYKTKFHQQISFYAKWSFRNIHHIVEMLCQKRTGSKVSKVYLPAEIVHGGSPSNPYSSADPRGRLTRSAAFPPPSFDCHHTLPDLASLPLPPHSAIIRHHTCWLARPENKWHISPIHDHRCQLVKPSIHQLGHQVSTPQLFHATSRLMQPTQPAQLIANTSNHSMDTTSDP